MIEKLKAMGPMRNMLHGLAIALMLILPFTEPSWNPRGSDLFLGAVVPAITPIVIVNLMLDVLMCMVLQSDTEDQDIKRRYSTIVKTNIGIAGLLLFLWLNAFRDALYG